MNQFVNTIDNQSGADVYQLSGHPRYLGEVGEACPALINEMSHVVT